MNSNIKGVLVGYLLVMLKNIVPMICFTILAIIFKYWWISLFSILFWSSPKMTIGDKDEN